MIDLRKIQRNAPLRTYVGGVGATGLIAAIAGGAVAFALDVGGPILGVAAIAVAFVGAVAICLMWWRGLDEAAREAHKWAWWWGGTAGTAVSALIMLGLLALSGADGALVGPFAAMSPVAVMQTAVLGVLGFQVVGYGVAWGVWWLARR